MQRCANYSIDYSSLPWSFDNASKHIAISSNEPRVGIRESVQFIGDSEYLVALIALVCEGQTYAKTIDYTAGEH